MLRQKNFFDALLKNVKSRSKIALLSNEGHFEIWCPKKKTVTFNRSKLSKLHKKTQFCMWQLFSLKQGETRTSSGPILPPLNLHLLDQVLLNIFLFFLCYPTFVKHILSFSFTFSSAFDNFLHSLWYPVLYLLVVIQVGLRVNISRYFPFHISFNCYLRGVSWHTTYKSQTL